MIALHVILSFIIEHLTISCESRFIKSINDIQVA